MRSMKAILVGILLAGLALANAAGAAATAAGAEATPSDPAVSAGRWRIVTVEMSGKPVEPEIVSMLSIIYSADGSWTVFFKSLPVAEGTSTVDQTTTPKTFEMHTLGSPSGNIPGRSYCGIYELEGNRRRLCFVPAGRPRPEAFATARRTEQILVTLERITSR